MDKKLDVIMKALYLLLSTRDKQGLSALEINTLAELRGYLNFD